MMIIIKIMVYCSKKILVFLKLEIKKKKKDKIKYTLKTLS
jgi:hypothetical protein